MPKLWESLHEKVFEAPSSDQPLILTDASPLARYGHLDILAAQRPFRPPPPPRLAGGATVARPAGRTGGPQAHPAGLPRPVPLVAPHPGPDAL